MEGVVIRLGLGEAAGRTLPVASVEAVDDTQLSEKLLCGCGEGEKRLLSVDETVELAEALDSLLA